MTKPKYSFIVPVFNGEKTILDAVFSLIRQTYPSFEIIIVDNASTDGTKKAIQGLSGVRYIFVAKQGRSIARNTGARLARGEYLAFVDADVVLDLTWLEEVDRYLREIALDALATRVAPRSEGDTALDRYREHFASWKSGETFLSVRSRVGAYPLINTAACVIRRNIFHRVGGFDETLVRHEDLDLSYRLFSQGFLLGGVSAAKASVRFTANRESRFGRELAYLKRAFEVQNLFLWPSEKSPVNIPLLKEIFSGARCPKTLSFGLLVEASRQLGALWRRHRKPPQKSWKRKPGRNVLCTVFPYQGRRYFLNPGVNFIFIDGSVYLCPSPFESMRLEKVAARGFHRLCGGRALRSPEARSLMRLGVFYSSEANPPPVLSGPQVATKRPHLVPN